jgi:C4-dicarboxylate-specific signal transduction histidine kinase
MHACYRSALLGSLLGIYAHEMNNILTPIIGRVETALASGSPADWRGALERIASMMSRAEAISSAVLGLTRTPPNGLSTAQVAAALREAISMLLRPPDRDGSEVRADIPEELAARIPQPVLEEIFLNLLLHARQAMEDVRGLIYVEAERESDKVRITMHLPSRVAIERAIAPLRLFFAGPIGAPHEWQHVGLPLAACKWLAKSVDGTLDVVSGDAPLGCSFVLTLPATYESAQK